MSYLQIRLDTDGEEAETHAQVLRRLAANLEAGNAPTTPGLIKDFTGDVVGAWETVTRDGVPWA